MARRRLLVGIAAKATEQSRRIEHERRPHHRHAGGEHPLERQSQLPAARRSRLEQRVRRGAPKRLRPARAEECTRASVQHALCGSYAHDEVGFEQPSIDAHGCASGIAEMDEIRRFRVVHLDHAVEAAGGDRWKERLLLAVSRSAVEPSRDQDRLLLRPHAKPLELGERRRECLAPRVVRSGR